MKDVGHQLLLSRSPLAFGSRKQFLQTRAESSGRGYIFGSSEEVPLEAVARKRTKTPDNFLVTVGDGPVKHPP
jgi:hypothetical protein